MTISTTPRKIVSLSSTYNAFNFPQLDSIQLEPPIIGVTTVYSEILTFDDEGNETGTETISTEIPIRDKDGFVPEQPAIFLYRDLETDRDYYSVHQDYTEEILAQGYYVPGEDAEDRYEGDLELLSSTTEQELFALRFEDRDALGPEFTEKVLLADQNTRAKYLEDNDYAYNIGLCTCTESGHHHVCEFMHEVDGCVVCVPSTDPDDNTNFLTGAPELPSPDDE